MNKSIAIMLVKAVVLFVLLICGITSVAIFLVYFFSNCSRASVIKALTGFSDLGFGIIMVTTCIMLFAGCYWSLCKLIKLDINDKSNKSSQNTDDGYGTAVGIFD
jgi:hypothetical protein